MPRPALMTKRPGGRTKWLAVVLVTALCTAVAVMTFGSPDMKSPGVADAAEVGTTVGTAQYPVPAGAVVVSPSGNDSAAGTAAAPYRTLTKAASAAAAGATIVLRAGTYHESVAVYKRVTIQSWPGETVWLDGSVPVNDWAASGGRWKTGWYGRVRRVADVHARRARQHRGRVGVRQRQLPDGRAPGSDLDRRRRAAPSGIARAKSRPGTFFHDEGAQPALARHRPVRQGRARERLDPRADDPRRRQHRPRHRHPPLRTFRPGHGRRHLGTRRHPPRERGDHRLGDDRPVRRVESTTAPASRCATSASSAAACSA